MIVVVASECSGKARAKTQRIIDEFLPRIGRRTWSGRITQEGLRRLRETLAKTATKSTSICCHRAVGTRRLLVQWFIGNRRKFDRQGNCAVSESSKLILAERESSDFERLCRAVTELAALFHDLGKSTIWFQNKLRSRRVLSDPIRHEVVSYAVIKAMFMAAGGEQEWLSALCDSKNLKTSIQKGFLDAFSEPDLMLLGRKGSRRLSLLENAVASSPAPRIHFEPAPSAPRFSLVAALVLTHHRLPVGVVDKYGHGITLGNMTNGRFPSEGSDVTLVEALEKVFSLPEGLVPLWEDAAWLDQVVSCAERLRDLTSQDFDLDLKAISIFGRTALILGDHKASQVGNTRFPKDSDEPDNTAIYANTNRAKGGALAEQLASHLTRTRKEAGNALDISFALQEAFPSLERSEVPEMITSPRIRKDSPFRWQVDASRITRRELARLPEGSGLFAILMAGTGSGKTRAAPTVMAAASFSGKPGLRLNVCTGMRSLTLQGGLEYRRDMGFQSEDVSVVVGDRLTRELFDLSHGSEHPVGTEADGFPEHQVVQTDFLTSTRVLPSKAMRLVGEEPSSPAVSMLAAPVLVSTIDILMPSADARRGSHVLKTLRLSTADLVLDEIDGYGNEDIVAISRLIFLSASFGRRVMISSATVTPEIAECLFEAYREGWRIHCHASGLDLPVLAGWYSDLCSPRCAVIGDVKAFNAEHTAFAEEMVTALDKREPSRVAKVATFDAPDGPDELFRQIGREITALHDTHHLVDKDTGKRLSLGVVRWNNVAPSMMHAKHLLDNGLGGMHDVFVIPYNGTLLPAVRHRLEEAINPMLRRRLQNGEDPVLHDPQVRRILEERSSLGDVIIVMVATSVEETGRDHDFDWAIVEPGSLRGLIQMAGRVRRHRLSSVSAPNIAIMEKCFRDFRNQWSGSGKGLVFAYPGIETPLPDPKDKKTYAERFHMASHEADYVYDMTQLGRAVDAKDVICPGTPASRIGEKERELLKAFLSDGLGQDLRLSVPNFLKDPRSLITDYHPKNRRFRRTSGVEMTYWLRATDEDFAWYWIDESGRHSRHMKCDNMVESVNIDDSRLFLQLPKEGDLAKEILQRLPGNENSEWKVNALLSIQRPLRNKAEAGKTRFHYHSALGFTETKPWTIGHL